MARKSRSRNNAANGLTDDFADLMNALRTLVDPYRPELHYMRGPGPKWHAKHDATSRPMDVPALAPARAR